MEIIELVLDSNDNMSGIEAISVVESPATESDFIVLKSQEIQLAQVDTEKRILMGVALIPDKHIYRKDGDREYYIFFSKETVNLASQLYLKQSKQSSATLEHESKINDMTVVESWIVENPNMDKSKHYGLNVPKGTWMVSMKVDNEKIWNEFVKTGKVKGFSIEGYFADKVQMNTKIKDVEDLTENEAEDLYKKIIDAIEKK
jgi:hypothetical protein